MIIGGERAAAITDAASSDGRQNREVAAGASEIHQ
jgi:hypothetical protein